MKKNEDAAAKRKPKTSAAQIRVQKGMCLLSYPTSTPLAAGTRVLIILASHRPDRARPPEHDEDDLARRSGSSQLYPHNQPR